MRSSDEGEEGDEQDEYVIPQDVVRALGMSPRTVSRWIENGWLSEVITLGGHHRFRREEIEALAEEMKREKDVGG